MGGVTNRLLVGDNLDVLRRLAADGERFDLLYLDPPYNTGHDFAYRDRFSSHDAWAAMVRPRLEAGHGLLRETGAVCASIDDHEVVRLRTMLDEVYGEAGFLAQVVVNLNAKGRQLGRGFATSHEYLLVYARDPRLCVLDASSERGVDERDFPLVDDRGRRHRRLPLRNTNKRFNPRTARTLHYPLWGDPASGRVATGPFEGGRRIEPVFGDGRPAVWRWSPGLVDQRTGDLLCRTVGVGERQRVDVFQLDWLHPDGPDGLGRRKKLTTIWLAEEVGSTDTAVAELKALVGHVFECPKPTDLLRRVLETMPADAAVLDPFAGSGTTGHAVALANAEDGGTRTCVSIESPTSVRPGSNAHEAGLATLADITEVRLRAVAATVGGGLSVSFAGPPS